MSRFAEIAPGWEGAGRQGVSLGEARFIRPDHLSAGQYWTHVLWANQEDLDWQKTSSLIACTPKKIVQRWLERRLIIT